MLTFLTGCVLGLLAGIRHALEPDHIAAVTSMVLGGRSTKDRSSRRTLGFATAWGAGHALVLFAVAGLLHLLGRALPASVTDVFELAVAGSLVALGGRAMWGARRMTSTGPSFDHEHADRAHAHAGPRDHVHVKDATFARLPFVVGLVHGLAGSGALSAIAVGKLSAVAGLGFIGVYSAGSVVGMVLLAGAMGIPLARLGRTPRVAVGLLVASGAVSMALGVAFGLPIAARLAG